MSVAPAEMYDQALLVIFRLAASSKSGSPTISERSIGRSPSSLSSTITGRGGRVEGSTEPTRADGSSRSAMIPGEWIGSKITVASRPATLKMGAVPPGWMWANWCERVSR